MNNNSRPSLSELLKSQNIQFSKDFFDSLNAVPHPYRKPMVEMILDEINGFQICQFLQIFAGIVYAPNPYYFLLFFEKTSTQKIFFECIRKRNPNELIQPMQRIKMYDEDEHNRRQRASLNLPINWRTELRNMNYN